jgi:hypothetical protein
MKNNSNIHNSKTNQHNVTNLRSSQLPRKSDLGIPEDQSENLESSFNEKLLEMSDYIQEVEPSKKTRESIQNWSIKNREDTEAKTLKGIFKLLTGSLSATFFIIAVSIANPQVDKNFVKDIIPLLISPQLTLLGGAFGTYVLRNRDKKNKR